MILVAWMLWKLSWDSTRTRRLYIDREREGGGRKRVPTNNNEAETKPRYNADVELD